MNQDDAIRIATDAKSTPEVLAGHVSIGDEVVQLPIFRDTELIITSKG